MRWSPEPLESSCVLHGPPHPDARVFSESVESLLYCHTMMIDPGKFNIDVLFLSGLTVAFLPISGGRSLGSAVSFGCHVNVSLVSSHGNFQVLNGNVLQNGFRLICSYNISDNLTEIIFSWSPLFLTLYKTVLFSNCCFLKWQPKNMFTHVICDY